VAVSMPFFAAGARRARTFIALGAAASALGVALSASVSPEVGGPLLVAGWLAFILGVHGFGRAGPA
jgi:hypothetical protein